MVLGGLLVGIGWIASAFATNIYILTLTYGVLIGTGVGIIYGVPINMIAKWFPDKKGLATGLTLVGFGLSPFITAPIARYLVESQGVMKTFLILGIGFIIILPLLALLMKNPVVVQEVKIEIDTDVINLNSKEMIKSKEFKVLYINFLFGTMIGLMIIGITSNVGVELINLDLKTVATLMSLFAVFNGIGRVLFGIIADKYSSKIAMTISYILIIIAGIIMLMAGPQTTILYMIAFCILWLNLGGWLAIAPTTTLNLFGTKNYSTNYGVIFTAYGVGAILGVIISGSLKETFGGYAPVFYFMVGISIIGLIITLVGFKNKKVT